jgi:hypothetical protein
MDDGSVGFGRGGFPEGYSASIKKQMFPLPFGA